MTKYLLASTTLIVASFAFSTPAFASGSGTADDPYTGSITDFNPDSSSSASGGGTVYIKNITSGYLLNDTTNAHTISANLYITYDASDTAKNGITFTDGYSGVVYTFTGSISGDGNWTFSSGSGTTPTQHYIFTGDLSGYSGNFSMTAGSSSNSEGYLEFGNGGQAATNTAVSGTGSITTSSSGSGFAVIYNYGSYAGGSGEAITISNSSITTEDLQFTGSVNYIVSSTLAGYNTNAKMTISNTGTTTLSGAVSGFGTITINSGSTLAVGSGATLDLTGTTVNIGSTIQNAGSITMTSTTTLVIDTKVLTGSGDWTNGMTYTLITDVGTGTIEGYNSAAISSNVYGATSVVSYDSGKLTVTFTDNAEATGLHGSGESDHAYYTTGGGTSTTSKFSFDVSNLTQAGTTVYLATATESFGSTDVDFYWSSSVNATCDIVIGAAGIYLTDGSASNVHTFSGKISGDGGLTVTNVANSSTGSSVKQHYAFTGDLSGWNGDITISTTNANDYLAFGGTLSTGNVGGTGNQVTAVNGVAAVTNTSVSGNGAISVDYGTVYYAYTDYVAGSGADVLTVTNKSIEAHQIVFAGAVNYDVSSNLTGWDVPQGGTSASDGNSSTDSTLTISTSGTVTVSGAVSDFDSIEVGSNSGLTIASTAKVTLKDGSTLSVSEGGTLTLNTSIAATGATVSFAEGASLVLTDAFLASAIESAINTLDAAEGVAINIIVASAIQYDSSELGETDLDDFVSNVISYDTGNYLLSNWTYDSGTLSATVTYLPEPALFSVFFGLGALGLVATRRRRRRVA